MSRMSSKISRRDDDATMARFRHPQNDQQSCKYRTHRTRIYSQAHELFIVRYSVTLIKLRNKFKYSLSAYYVSVYCYSVYFQRQLRHVSYRQ